jgi:ribonucleoside-diphosphate reductase alpha chain
MPVWYQEGKILSCSDAIAKAIEWHLQDKKKVKGEVEAFLNEPVQIFLRGACPECGGPLLFEEGCVKCLCGYSDCG